MAASQLTPAGRRVLAAASGLFYAEGIHAVGVDAIAAAAGVTKKTLYDQFGAKDELVVAYLRGRDQRWREWLTQATRTGGARDRVLASFDALARWLREESPRGCAFLNALAELPDVDHPARAVITEQKEWLREHLHRLVGAEATQAAQAERLADQLMVLHEGAVAMHHAGVVAEPVRSAREAAAALFDRAAGPGSRTRRALTSATETDREVI